ncbi:uncharacterized protein [Pyxicephalus adspersus]|uniref:uncharacterized protein isoform X2 n=1 Tax=Pyxicephalus adspersus TaxID=30357 RepID=UPI003B58FF63
MFNAKGGLPGQRPMGPPQMNQPGLNHLGINMSGINMSGMNMSGMGMSGMNQPNVNLSGMNQSNLNTGMNSMGHPGMDPNAGTANLNQPGLNVYRMGPSGMNQGGMGFQSEVKSQGFGMRPMDSPGSFLGGNSEPMGMKNLPLGPPESHMGPQALPQHFSSPSGPMIPAQPRMHLQNQEMSMVNRGLPHSSDHLRGDAKTSLQEPHLLEKKPLNSLGMFGNLNQDMGIKPGPSLSLNQMSNAQNLYTNENASSILEVFGLSNEDLEELSRYPDNQLTPKNLPNILKDIRLRKNNNNGATHNQVGGGGRRSGSDVLPSKVIDYGHSSKYQFNDNTKSTVITIQPDSAASPVGTVVSHVNYPPPVEATTPTGKGNRVLALSQEGAQMKKRMPTPSMMNDYFAASPRIFPHTCSLCNLECRHLKDWIKHQNNTIHIDSCRKLRQQYPDWNPQVHTLRNEGKKDGTTPKRSRSKSRSPRRARRSGSRHRARRSRSRSPWSGRRSRSRSPRRSWPSPRSSCSPYKSPRSPRRSLSPRRYGRGQSSTPPDQGAVDAAVQSFIEASKLKSGEKGRPTRSSSDTKKLSPKSSNSSVKGKKPSGGSTPTKNPGGTEGKNSISSSYSSSSQKPGSSSSVKSGTNSSGLRNPLSSNTSKKQFISKSTSCKIIHVTNLPDSGYTDQDIIKAVQPLGKVHDILIVRSKNEAFLETNFTEAAVKFSETLPVIINGKRVTLSLARKQKEQTKTKTKATSSETDYNMDEEDATPADEIGQLAKRPLPDTHVAKRNVKVTGTFVKVEVEEDGDDEEAAEAPEAPEAPYCIQPWPVVEQPKYSSDPQPYVTEDSNFLVSVESDEEECEVHCRSTFNAIPVINSVSMEHLLTAEESDSNDMETSAKEMSGGCPKPVDNASAVDSQNVFVGKPEEARNRLGVETSDAAAELSVEACQAPNTTFETKYESVHSLKGERSKRSKENAHSYEEKSRQRQERNRQSSHGRKVDKPVREAGEEFKDTEQAAVTNTSSVTRTAKYNPQRGELSVTLTVDNQKSSLGTPEYRKKSSGAWASSGRESSTSKSSSNWSSPSENVYSNPKTSTGSYQSKSSYRGVSTQHRDSKYNSRSWENDFRLNRKGDQSKDSSSSSSRYVRSSTRSNRGQKSKEESASTFPFNLDEFVTVDEIVEEHADEQKPEEVEEEKSQEIAASKRMESSPAALDAKKPKEASGDTQELTFVTLDEVGDEEDITPVPERLQDGEVQTLMTVDEVQTLMTVDEVQTLMTVDEVQTLMTVDEVHSKDGPPPAAQQPSVLMTLDQVSDDEEPNISTMLSGTSAITDKDQLLTLDEISSKDEETVPNSEPLNPDIWFTQVTKESKEDNSSPAPEIKENVEAPDIPPQEPAQDSHVEQPLLTLDEVKADEEEEDSLAIEHQFLTVDEIGEEDEESEVKQDTVEKSQPKPKSKSGQSKSKTSPKSASKTPGGRRGRPRKRPLPETADDSKDTSQQASADSITGSGLVKTPTKPEQKAAEDPEQDKSEDSTITTPDIPGLSTSTSSDTPAKKNKLESPSLGKKTLGLFNCLIPVGLEFVVPKTGYFCELCSLFYMDDASKLKHCKSLRHYQAVQRHFAKEEDTAEEKSPST